MHGLILTGRTDSLRGPPDAHAAIDEAYDAKYDRYGPGIVGSVVGSHAAQGTLRLVLSD